MDTNIKNRSFRIVVAGIIVKDNSILLLQRHGNEKVFPNLWELPSGKRDFGENSIRALEREIMEESGLSVTIEKPFSVFEYVIEKETEIRDTTQINFLAHLKKQDQKPRVSKEHQAVKWFSKKDVEILDSISAETKSIAISVLT